VWKRYNSIAYIFSLGAVEKSLPRITLYCWCRDLLPREIFAWDFAIWIYYLLGKQDKDSVKGRTNLLRNIKRKKLK